MPNGNGEGKRKCPVCGQEFTPKVPWQIYDSKQCGSKMRDRRRYAKIKKAIELLESAKT